MVFFSCQKETRGVSDLINSTAESIVERDNIKYIDGNIESVSDVGYSNIGVTEKGFIRELGEQWNTSLMKRAVYPFSERLTGFLINSVDDPNLSLLVYANGSRYFKVVVRKQKISANAVLYNFSSEYGDEYLSFKETEGKFVSNIVAQKALPFKSIMTSNEREIAKQQSPPVGGDGCTDLDFANCIVCAIFECAQDYRCAIMCGLFIGPPLCTAT